MVRRGQPFPFRQACLRDPRCGGLLAASANITPIEMLDVTSTRAPRGAARSAGSSSDVSRNGAITFTARLYSWPASVTLRAPV